MTFLAAMDENGFAQFASVANLAHRARVTLEEGEAAVKCLESVDVNSSDPDNEGRRIERVHGGWVILNAEKYRGLVTRAVAQEKIRSRVADFRERKRTGIDAKIKAQDSKCACCSQPFQSPYKLYVVQDHNHATGAPRGIICQSCNKVVGFVETGRPTDHDKVPLCRSYLERWGWSNASVTASNVPVTQSGALANAGSGSAQPVKTATALPGGRPGELPLDVPPSPPIDVPYPTIVAEFHDACPSFPRITKLTESRKKAIRARFIEAEEPKIEWFRSLFRKAQASDLLSGRKKDWRAGFDWLLNPANSVKVMEGNYDNRESNDVIGKRSSMAG